MGGILSVARAHRGSIEGRRGGRTARAATHPVAGRAACYLVGVFYSNVTPVDARMYTTQFRVIGKMHLPGGRGTAEFLNADDRPHLAMTSCSMYAPGIEHPPKREDFRYETEFAAVPKDQVAWLVGGSYQTPDPAMPHEERHVYLVFPNYVLAGRVVLRPKVRTSDFLVEALGRRPFQTLFDARVMRPSPDASMFRLPVVERFDAVVVNLRAAGGIFDLAPDKNEPSYVLEE